MDPMKPVQDRFASVEFLDLFPSSATVPRVTAGVTAGATAGVTAGVTANSLQLVKWSSTCRQVGLGLAWDWVGLGLGWDWDGIGMGWDWVGLGLLGWVGLGWAGLGWTSGCADIPHAHYFLLNNGITYLTAGCLLLAAGSLIPPCLTTHSLRRNLDAPCAPPDAG